MNSNSRNLNYLYESNHNCNKSYTTRINRNNSFVDINSCENNRKCKLRMNNLENRISSLEKMLQYLDEFIHLKEEEKTENQNNILYNCSFEK